MDSRHEDLPEGATCSTNPEALKLDAEIDALEEQGAELDDAIEKNKEASERIWKLLWLDKTTGQLSAEETQQYRADLMELQKELEGLEARRWWNQQAVQNLQDQRTALDMPVPEGKLTGNRVQLLQNAVKAPAKMAVGMAQSGLKSAAAKANPFDKQIDKSDASDTGMESMRLAYTSGKKAASGIKSGIKTADRTIKTTQRTIKTTSEAVKEGSKAAYKAAEAGVKATVKVGKAVGNAVAAIIAEISNPWIIVVAIIIIMIVLLGAFVVILMSGGSAGATTTRRAYEEAAGLVEVDPQYDLGKQLLAQVWNDKRDEFNRLIDGLYYDPNNLTHSNLVYLERTEPEAPKLVFDKGFPTNEYKDNIKNNAWDFSFREEEILAIVYVYMEIQENQSNGTTDAIYQVEYTEDAVRAVIDKCVMFTDTVYNGQYCKDQNCTVHTDRHKNPEWERANDENNRRWDAYWDWYNNVYSVIYDNGNIRDGSAAQAHWNNTVQPAIDRWQRDHNRTAYNVTWERGYWFCNSVLLPEARDSENWKNNTPEYITDTSYSCEHAHDLHSIGLAFYSAEDVMNALGFSENEKQWANLTVTAFEQQNTP